jgi:S-formylglutathione hydrolase FrmB
MRVAALPILLFAAAAPAAEPATFTLTFDKTALAEPFTGRVVVVLARSKPSPVVRGLSWGDTEPAFAVAVKGWKPGTPLVIGGDAISTVPLKDVKPGRYFAQAVLDRDLGGISFAASPGNLYSKAAELKAFDPATAGDTTLTLDQVAEERKFLETDAVKLVDVESALLTKFHGRPTRMRAGVVLPPSFAKEPDRKYPVVYEITGFGGDHFAALGRRPATLDGTEFVWVVLDGNCRLGHHVFADSANNGPWGTALITELIPHIEKKYRCVGTPKGRLVTGHSSGGWSSLWLQVAYPDTFGGCWSTSPDPVDFRNFQRVDIYTPNANLFTDPKGGRRALSRSGGRGTMYFDSFSRMEEVMGRGGQLESFEAVFSPRGKDGKPRKLWDRKTGAIDPDVAEAWEAYDISLKLKREWPTLGPKLAGKVHVYMGDEDTFYLDGAARLLKRRVAKLDSDAVVEMFPGKTHALVDAKLRERINKEMAAAVGRAVAAEGHR